MDTIGTEESVLNKEVSSFQGLNCVRTSFGERKCVLIREVSVFHVCVSIVFHGIVAIIT